MIREIIILAGGLGTRLRSAVPDVPKVMAPVAGKPFLGWIISYFQQQQIGRFIFSLGFKAEIIEEYLIQHFPQLDYVVSVETEPLGTGGAIKLAMEHVQDAHVLVTNGDTFFATDTAALSAFHAQHKSECTLALKPMQNSERYGVVELSPANRIVNFREKNFYTDGYINGGLYALSRNAFDSLSLPEKFSFENDYLQRYYNSRPFYGFILDNYFIDIGIPEDYQKANNDFASPGNHPPVKTINNA